MTAIINKRLLFSLIIAFIFATIIGTLSHECGHYFAARLMGFNATINYGSTWLTDDSQSMTSRQETWFILGGPLQTMLTGTLGFLLLIRSRRPAEKLSPAQWIFVFLSLFWLRQPANLVVGIAGHLITGFWANTGDEVKLSILMRWPQWTIITFTAFIGVFVLAFIIKVIPQPQRFTFMLAGLIGGVTGYCLWLIWLGKIVMP